MEATGNNEPPRRPFDKEPPSLIIRNKMFSLLEMNGLSRIADETIEAKIKEIQDQCPPEEILELHTVEALRFLFHGVRSKKTDLLYKLSDVYLHTFSESEIDDMIAFFSSAVGRHLISIGSLFAPGTDALMYEWCRTLFADLGVEMSRILDGEKPLPQPPG